MAGKVTDRTILTRQLSRAASALDPEMRRAFRKFLAEQDAPPKPRKVHSWRRKAGKGRAPKPPRQGSLDL